MIQIKIKNHRQILRKERSRLVSTLAPFFVDVEQRVEEEIVKQIQQVFESHNIEADFEIVLDGSSPASPSSVARK
ncbi:MAG: hypothetical protein ACRBF0_08925 [Calditrichia bacterium]